MPLINDEINLILTWSSVNIITNSTDVARSAKRDTNPYVPVVTLLT